MPGRAGQSILGPLGLRRRNDIQAAAPSKMGDASRVSQPVEENPSGRVANSSSRKPEKAAQSIPPPVERQHLKGAAIRNPRASTSAKLLGCDVPPPMMLRDGSLGTSGEPCEGPEVIDDVEGVETGLFFTGALCESGVGIETDYLSGLPFAVEGTCHVVVGECDSDYGSGSSSSLTVGPLEVPEDILEDSLYSSVSQEEAPFEMNSARSTTSEFDGHEAATDDDAPPSRKARKPSCSRAPRKPAKRKGAAVEVKTTKPSKPETKRRKRKSAAVDECVSLGAVKKFQEASGSHGQALASTGVKPETKRRKRKSAAVDESASLGAVKKKCREPSGSHGQALASAEVKPARKLSQSEKILFPREIVAYFEKFHVSKMLASGYRPPSTENFEAVGCAESPYPSPSLVDQRLLGKEPASPTCETGKPGDLGGVVGCDASASSMENFEAVMRAESPYPSPSPVDHCSLGKEPASLTCETGPVSQGDVGGFDVCDGSPSSRPTENFETRKFVESSSPTPSPMDQHACDEEVASKMSEMPSVFQDVTNDVEREECSPSCEGNVFTGKSGSFDPNCKLRVYGSASGDDASRHSQEVKCVSPANRAVVCVERTSPKQSRRGWNRRVREHGSRLSSCKGSPEFLANHTLPGIPRPPEDMNHPSVDASLGDDGLAVQGLSKADCLAVITPHPVLNSLVGAADAPGDRHGDIGGVVGCDKSPSSRPTENFETDTFAESSSPTPSPMGKHSCDEELGSKMSETPLVLLELTSDVVKHEDHSPRCEENESTGKSGSCDPNCEPRVDGSSSGDVSRHSQEVECVSPANRAVVAVDRTMPKHSRRGSNGRGREGGGIFPSGKGCPEFSANHTVRGIPHPPEDINHPSVDALLGDDGMAVRGLSKAGCLAVIAPHPVLNSLVGAADAPGDRHNTEDLHHSTPTLDLCRDEMDQDQSSRFPHVAINMKKWKLKGTYKMTRRLGSRELQGSALQAAIQQVKLDGAVVSRTDFCKGLPGLEDRGSLSFNPANPRASQLLVAHSAGQQG